MSEQAKRRSGGKPPLSFIPLSALEGAAQVFEFGAGIYGRGNWAKGMPHDEYINSTLRHMAKMQDDGVMSPDEESGIPHIDHAIANLLMLRWCAVRKINPDTEEWTGQEKM